MCVCVCVCVCVFGCKQDLSLNKIKSLILHQTQAINDNVTSYTGSPLRENSRQVFKSNQTVTVVIDSGLSSLILIVLGEYLS